MESNKQCCHCHNLGNKEDLLWHMCVFKVPTEFNVAYHPGNHLCGSHCLTVVIMGCNVQKETDPFVNIY